MEKKEDKQVRLGETKQIELPSLDIKQYVGMKAKISEVTEHEGHYGYYIKVATQVLDSKEFNGEPVSIKATRVFGLQTDENGTIGWGADTNLGLFLKKMNVSHYNDLVGKDVVVQTVTNKNDGRDYLSFN